MITEIKIKIKKMRLLKSNSLLGLVNSYIVDSPQPANLSYRWNFGSLLALCLGIQIVTGIILAIHYTANVDLAFISVEHIMRDVNYGWMIRYIHANVASFFFIFVYLHIGRGLYYGSYKSPRVLPWSIGVIMLVLIIGIAFLGYIYSQTHNFDHEILYLTLVPVQIPSRQLKIILSNNNLNPKYVFEYVEPNYTTQHKLELSNKKLLNSLAGVYICINKLFRQISFISSSYMKLYL